jgi:hypothetical protein
MSNNTVTLSKKGLAAPQDDGLSKRYLVVKQKDGSQRVFRALVPPPISISRPGKPSKPQVTRLVIENQGQLGQEVSNTKDHNYGQTSTKSPPPPPPPPPCNKKVAIFDAKNAFSDNGLLRPISDESLGRYLPTEEYNNLCQRINNVVTTYRYTGVL